MKKRLLRIIIFLCAMVFLYFALYTVLTPSIRGVVFDEITAKPVEDAWVIATAFTGVISLAGSGGGNTYLITSRHTRTDKNGAFSIPPRFFFGIPTPLDFAKTRGNCTISVRVSDGRRAEVDVHPDWWKKIISLDIPVGPKVRNVEEVRSDLNKLVSYCLSGSYAPIYSPYTSTACDKWEMAFVIAEQEKLLRLLSNLKDEIDRKVYYPRALYTLALLHKHNGEYGKALQLARKARNMDLQNKIKWHIVEYDELIKEMETQLKQQ